MKTMYIFDWQLKGYFDRKKKFYKFKNLLKFLQKVPPHELKHSRVLKHKTGENYYYVGQFFSKKRGGLSVKF